MIFGENKTVVQSKITLFHESHATAFKNIQANRTPFGVFEASLVVISDRTQKI